MTSIQIGALLYFTLIAVGAWIFFGVIFIQLKRFIDMSCHVPLVSKILTTTLVILTLLGYAIILFPSLFSFLDLSIFESREPTRTSGYFDTY